MGRVCIVANAQAGSSRAPALASALSTALTGAGHNTVIALTSGADEARHVVDGAVVEGACAVIACGGDGTVSSVHAGLVGTGVGFGIVPAGSGDDIAASLGFDGNLVELAAAVDRPRRAVDAALATVEGHPPVSFLGVLSAGFDSAVNDRANRLPRLAGQRYRVAMLAELASFRPIEYVFEIDGTAREAEGMLIAVGNGDRYGNGMRICPDAVADDGLVDVVLLRAMSRARLLRLFPRVYSGRHVESDDVEVYRGAKVRIHASGPSAYADGEAIGPLPVEVTVARGAVEVLVPTRA